MRGGQKWIEKLSRWLPYHQDQYFLALNNTVWGSYKNRYKPPEDEAPAEDPDAIKARALAALADFGRRSKTAMAAYQDHKSMGRA